MSKKVLVVDDDPSILMACAEMLKFNRYIPLMATSAEKALAFFRQSPEDIALVITDLRMPDINGIQFLRSLRALDCEVPVIIFTVFPEVKPHPEFEQLRINAIVEKKGFEELEKKVKEILG